MHPILLLSSIILGSTSSVHPDVLPNCDGLIEPSVLSIERRLDNIEEKRGASVTLRCSFYSAPQPTIIWYHRGKKIDGHLAPNFESLLTTTQLGQSIVESSKDLIDCLDESTSGEYFCEATSPCSPPIVTSSIVTIRKDTNLSIATKQPLCKPQQKRFNHSPVNSAPIIADFTISRLELPGGVAQLACRARGYPTPKVSWKRIEDDDSLTSISGLSSYMQLTNGDLLVVGDESTISESFRCSAENKLGIATADASVIYMLP